LPGEPQQQKTVTSTNSTGDTAAALKDPDTSVQAEPTLPQPLNTTDGQAKTEKARDPWPDNARFIAAVLIVVMHFAVEVIERSDLVKNLFFATWPKRVPLYALLAGYFSSAAPITSKRGIVLLRNVLFVYLLFEFLQTVQKWALNGKFDFNPGTPSFALWFLLSLFFWRLSLPLLSRIRWIIPLSIVAALLVGYASQMGPELSASRTVAFLPIFLVGWKLREIGLHKTLDRVWVRVAAVAFYAFWFTYVVYNVDDLKRRWFSMTRPYRGDDLDHEMLMRAMVLTVGILGALALLALVPRTKLMWITYLGSGSMYIYLLHPLIVRQFGYHGYFDTLDSRAEVLLMLAGSALIGTLLATPPVRKILKPLVQPTYTWLFHTDERKTR
jgi:fucose 4-O-acetylase-like acetyltransferase